MKRVLVVLLALLAQLCLSQALPLGGGLSLPCADGESECVDAQFHVPIDPFQILNEDPREKADAVRDATLKTVCRKSDGKELTATAFAVELDPNAEKSARLRYALVTALHVLTSCQSDGDTFAVILRYRAGRSRQWVQELRRLGLSAAGRPIWLAHPTDDNAAMPIDLPDGMVMSALPTTMLASREIIEKEALPGRVLWAMGFPFGGQLGGQFGGQFVGSPITQFVGVLSQEVDSRGRLPVYSQLFPGDSGGPVFVIDQEGRTFILGLVSEAVVARKTYFVGGYIATAPGILETLNSLIRNNASAKR